MYETLCTRVMRELCVVITEREKEVEKERETDFWLVQSDSDMGIITPVL